MSAVDTIRMANQIAQFFAPYPEEEAVDEVRNHLVKFWPVAMRSELVVLLEGPHVGDLHPLALQAAQRLMSLDP